MAIPIAATLTLSTSAFTGGLKVASTGLSIFTRVVTAATIAVAGLGAALAAIGARQIAFVDRLGKISDVVGLSTDLIQKFGFAAEIAGVSFEQSSVALRRFSRRLGEAKRGTGELLPALRALGISNAEISAMSAEEALFALADGIAKTSGESERLSIAFKAFDSEGAELVNTLNEGSEALKEMFQTAEDLGIILERDAIREVENLNDELTTLMAVVNGAANALLVSLAPALTETLRSLTQLIVDTAEAHGGFDEFGQFLKEEFLSAIQSIAQAMMQMYNAFATVFNFLVEGASSLGLVDNRVNNLKEGIADLKEEAGKPFLLRFDVTSGETQKVLDELFGGFFFMTEENIDKGIAALEARLQQLTDEGESGLKLPLFTQEQISNAIQGLEKLKEVAVEVNDGIEEVVVKSQARFTKAVGFLDKLFGKDLVNKFLDALDEMEEAGGGFLLDLAEGLLGSMEAFLTNLPDKLRAAGVGDFLTTMQDGFVKAATMLEDSLADAIATGKADFSSLGEHIKKVLAKALVQKFITGPIMSIFGLASGGPATGGRPYIVGEEGPELFVPNTSGTVVPNDQLMSGGGTPMAGGTVNYNIQAVDAASFKQLVARDPEFIFNVTQAGARRIPG